MTGGACPECGAAPVDGRACQDLLHDLLDRKYATDAAEYGVAVACYTLQHPARQSGRALEWARFHLRLAVEHGLPLAETRRAARARFDQRRREAPWPEPVASPAGGWRINIGQLATLPGRDDAERILEWARAILENLETGDEPAAAGDRPRPVVRIEHRQDRARGDKR